MAWDASGLSIRAENPIAESRSEAAASTGSGQGLIGMGERATVNGGRLQTGIVNGRFVVDAWLPASVEEESQQ